MTFRVNARKSHSERRETLGAPPCLDWFSSASSRAPVRSLLLFFFLSSFFPSFLSLSLSTFTLLLFLLPPANVLPGSRPRYTFLPPAELLFSLPFPGADHFTLGSFFLRAFTHPFSFFSSLRYTRPTSISLSLALSLSLFVSSSFRHSPLLSLASRTRLSSSLFYFSLEANVEVETASRGWDARGQGTRR